MDTEIRKRRLCYRAWHRGTREADYLIGGFFDTYADGWGESDIAWFETLIEEQDVDIMAWALRAQPVPKNWQGRMMDVFQRLDFIAPIV